MRLRNKISEVRKSIIAIAFTPSPGQLNIVGSGFSVARDGAILSVAHLYNQIPTEHRERILGFAVVKQEENIEHYQSFPLRLQKKDDANDIALFHLENSDKTLLRPLPLGDSESVEPGDEAYFIGFPYAAQLIKDGFGITTIVNRTIISNVKRDGVDSTHPRNWFIIDAISNPGNSGCPLIDADTNKVIGVIAIAFRTPSRVKEFEKLDIREPMHIAGAKPINLAKSLLP